MTSLFVMGGGGGEKLGYHGQINYCTCAANTEPSYILSLKPGDKNNQLDDCGRSTEKKSKSRESLAFISPFPGSLPF